MKASICTLRPNEAKVAQEVQPGSEALEIAREILAESYPDGFDILDHEQIARLRAEVKRRVDGLRWARAA